VAFLWVLVSVSRGLGPLLRLVVPGILSSESGSVSHGLGPHPVFGGTLNSRLHLRGRDLLAYGGTPNLRSPGSYFGVSLSGSFPAFGGTLHSVIDRLIFSISVSTVRLVVFGLGFSRLMMRRMRSRRASKAVTLADTCFQRPQRCSCCPRVDDPSSSDPETQTKYIGQSGWCGAWERKKT